jgi:hypothetical protein
MRSLIYKIIINFCFVSLITVFVSNESLANARSAWPGSFSRMGFGARGMAMGNAGNAIIHGAMGSYYNPATIAFTKTPTLDASIGLLSLDRSLHFAHFTTRIPPAAGFSISAINAGVSNIDGRNRDGLHTGYLSTSENLISFSFGAQINEKIAAGLSIKLFYYNLYDDMSSTTIGLDLGVVYLLNQHISFAAGVKDINSKYKWNSTALYEQQGRTTEDNFPVLFHFGGAYLSNDKTLLVSFHGEYSEAFDFIVRAGAEAFITENIILRGGIENILDDVLSKPSLGIGIRYPVGDWLPSFNYTLVFEPQAPSSFHVLSIGIEF